MHIWEGTLRPKNGDIERTCEWWKGLFGISGTEGFENGAALSRMDGENSVLIIRHTYDNLAHEERVFDAWTVGEVHKVIQDQWDEYVDGPPTFHRYSVLHSF
tara:strand:+ start:178 stop:483 length:306 start_codon:yes stop_codon:yes gene_type:complete